MPADTSYESPWTAYNVRVPASRRLLQSMVRPNTLILDPFPVRDVHISLAGAVGVDQARARPPASTLHVSA